MSPQDELTPIVFLLLLEARPTDRPAWRWRWHCFGCYIFRLLLFVSSYFVESFPIRVALLAEGFLFVAERLIRFIGVFAGLA